MSVDYKADVKPVIDTAAALAASLAIAPGTDPGIAAAAGISAVLLRLGSDLIAAGHDPVAVVARMRAADPLLAAAEADWQAALDAKFGGSP